MNATLWRWFAVESGNTRIRTGARIGSRDEMRRWLADGGMEPVLVLRDEQWEHDLAGGPDGLPERMRTTNELAQLRAMGEEHEIDWSSRRPWDWDDSDGVARPRGRGRPVDLHAMLRHRPRSPDDGPAGPPSHCLRVRAHAWARDRVAVAIVVAASGEALPGTQRLFAADDEGLVDAASWRGQLQFACELWAEEQLEDSTGAPRTEGPDGDAVTIARLLDDRDRYADD